MQSCDGISGHMILECHWHALPQAQQAEKRQQTKDEETEHFVSNMALLHVEEKQFQEYASGVIKEAHDRGAPIYPLKVAAKTGAGERGMGQ